MSEPEDDADALSRLRIELEAARAELRAAREQASYQEELIATQQLMIEELGAPFIPVSQTLAIVPLVGPVERARLERLAAQLSEAVSANTTQTLVLDFTGVGGLEPRCAAALVDFVRTLALLGTKTVFAGLGPEVARELAEDEELALVGFEYRRSLRELLEVRTRG